MLPGLGMDARMLQPQSSYFPNSYVLKLPPAKNAASLAAYASELVSEWPKQLPVLTVGPGHNGGKFFLAGVAFGGMLALEIALQVAQLASVQLSDDTQATIHRIAGVILIGSTRSHTNIPITFRVQEKLIARLPASVGRIAMKRTLSTLSNEEGMSDVQKQILLEMAHDSDWAQIRWGANKIAKWDRTGSSFEQMGIPIYQIHGRQDRSIKPPSVSDATLLILGRHLINLSMATEVNRWVEAILRDHDLNEKHAVATPA